MNLPPSTTQYIFFLIYIYPHPIPVYIYPN